MGTSCREVPWGQVTDSATKVLIIACGPSLRQIPIARLLDDDLQDVHVIGVNRAHDWTDRINSFFTLDPNEWFYEMLQQRRREGVTYYAAVPDDYGKSDSRWIAHRVPVIEGPVYLRRFAGNGFMRSRPTLSNDNRAINTGNSAWGALGLAYHLCRNAPWNEQKKVVILGLDGDRRAYAFGEGYPAGSFHHLPQLFNSARQQLDVNRIIVVNGNKHSTVNTFSAMSAEEALQWLAQEQSHLS